jgi:hypothetical protein
MAEGDEDKPQITPSPNSDEISPFDIQAISALARGLGKPGPSEALDKLAASAATGRRAAYDVFRQNQSGASKISRAPPPPPSLPVGNYRPDPAEAQPVPDESLRGDISRAMQDSERREKEVPKDDKSNLPPTSKKTFSMSRDDSIFWVSLASFGGGFSVMSLSPALGTSLVALGIAGLMWANRGHMPKPPWRMAALIVAMAMTCSFVMYDIYDRNFGHRIPTGRIWSALTDDQKKSLGLVLSALPKRDSIQVICLTTDCQELAQDFMRVFYEAEWNPVLGASSFFSQVPYGAVLYQTDVTDQRLKNAIEKTTNIRILRILPSAFPNLDSIFLGIKP